MEALDSGRLDELGWGLSMFDGVEVDRWICIFSTTDATVLATIKKSKMTRLWLSPPPSCPVASQLEVSGPPYLSRGRVGYPHLSPGAWYTSRRAQLPRLSPQSQLQPLT